MMPISDFSNNLLTDVSGLFRVLSKHNDWNDASQRVHTRIRIGDYSGVASVICDTKVLHQAHAIEPGNIIEAVVRPIQLDYVLGGQIREFRTVDPISVENIAWVLPKTMCPERAHASLADLVGILSRISAPPVRRFISSILNENFVDFMRAQGGWKYHHDYPGGLLVHSAAVAQHTEYNALAKYANDRPRVDLIVVGGLIHDFGKAQQIVKGQNDPVLGALPHEVLTLILVYPAIRQLATEWPEGAKLMSEILHWLLPPTNVRARDHDAALIHRADALDVDADRAQGCSVMAIAPLHGAQLAGEVA